jgi:hypothetical protein
MSKKPRPVEKKEEPNAQETPMEGGTELTCGQWRRLNLLLTSAIGVGGLNVKAHYWCTYYAEKLKGIVKTISLKLSEHEDFKSFSKAVSDPNQDPEAVKSQFADYLQYERAILDEVLPVPFTMRKIRLVHLGRGVRAAIRDPHRVRVARRPGKAD